MLLNDYGFNPAYLEGSAITGGLLAARICSVHKGMFKTISEEGEQTAVLRQGAYLGEGKTQAYPTVGDFVLVRPAAGGRQLVEKTLRRKSSFVRPDPDVGKADQVLAANFDNVFILTSLNRDFNLARLERYVAVAWNSGGAPAIVLTKADLCAEPGQAQSLVERHFPGVGVFSVSAVSGLGLSQLAAFAGQGKTAVFLGSSGVGKSSLVNALAGQELMPTGSIREGDAHGRHTTTHRQLLRLPSGLLVIDTPGMRQLGLSNGEGGLEEAFGDISRLAGACRYTDCGHQAEPGCAVRQAVADGTLSQRQLDSFFRLQREARHFERKAAVRQKMKNRRKKETRPGIADEW